MQRVASLRVVIPLHALKGSEREAIGARRGRKGGRRAGGGGGGGGGAGEGGRGEEG